MRKLLTNKFVLIVSLILVFSFFGAVTNTLTLNNRGIVVGLGLDYEDGEIVLSCQTLVAGSTGADKVSNNTYAVTSAKGRSLGESLQKIMSDSAEHVSFAHCNSILIGKGIANSNRLREVLEELLLNSKIMENTSLVYVDGNAYDMLREKVAINLMTSFAVQRMIASSKEYGNVTDCSIKDYLSSSKAKSGGVVMPILDKGVQIGESSAEQNKDSEQKILFSLRKSACVHSSGVAGILDEEETLVYNMVKKDFKDGNITVEVENVQEGMEIESKKVSQNYFKSEDGYSVECKVEITLMDMNYVNNYKRDENVASMVEEKYSIYLADKLTDLYNRFASIGIDVFSVYKSLYAKFGKEFKQEYPEFSSEINFYPTFEVKVGE